MATAAGDTCLGCSVRAVGLFALLIEQRCLDVVGRAVDELEDGRLAKRAPRGLVQPTGNAEVVKVAMSAGARFAGFADGLEADDAAVCSLLVAPGDFLESALEHLALQFVGTSVVLHGAQPNA
jgi:hypothetical protein